MPSSEPKKSPSPPTPLPLPKNVPRCSHTRLNGLRCGSPAMKGKRHCYFHRRLQLQQHRNSTRRARQRVILPPLEDAASIQFALMEVTQAVLDDRISEKKAGLVLYALQTASHNLRRLDPEPQEQLIRQDYPEAVPEMEKIKRVAAGDKGEENETLMRLLCDSIGLPTEAVIAGRPPTPSELPEGHSWDLTEDCIVPDDKLPERIALGHEFVFRPDSQYAKMETS